MSEKSSKSKIITVSLLIKDIQNDPHFFKLPVEVSEPDMIRDVILEKYSTNTGIIESFIDSQRIILQWSPEKIDHAAENLHSEAMEFAKAKQYDKAIEKWEKAIFIHSADVEYLYKLALVHFEMKKFHNSIRYLEKATIICPIHYRAKLLMGINWIKLRKFDRAEECVLASNRLNRSNILIYLNLGAIYSIQKRFNEAIDMFNTALQLSPSESRAYLGLARIYNMLSDVEMSNSYFKKVIELVPGTRMAEYAKRSIVVSNKAETDEGTTDNKENQLADGMQHYLSGDYIVSGRQYKSYLNSHPSDDYAWYLLGETNLRTGLLNESADCFKRAIKLNPKRGLYYKSLGIVLHYLGRSNEVVEILKKAIEMGKKDAICLTLQGINLNRQQKIEDAIQSYKMTLKKYHNNPLAMYNLALAFLQTDEKEQAVRLINEILAFDCYVPLKNKAKKVLKNLQSTSPNS